MEDNDLDATSYDEDCGEVEDSDFTAAEVATWRLTSDSYRQC